MKLYETLTRSLSDLRNQIRRARLGFGIAAILLSLALILAAQESNSGNGSTLPEKRDTANSVESNIKSLAKVNPTTLALEMTLPLFSYPGRNGNNISVDFRYSSNVWRQEGLHTWAYGGGLQRRYVSDIYALYAEHSAAGWTSSLLPPRIDEERVSYNFLGKPYGDSVDDSFLLGEFHAALSSIFDNETELGREEQTFECGMHCTQLYNGISGNRYCSSYQFWHCPVAASDHPDPDPVLVEFGAVDNLYSVRRLRVVMPDGSSHEFRRSDDEIFQCGSFSTGCSGSFDGTYLSVDGSGLTLVRAVGAYSLHLPNGGLYTFASGMNSTGGIYADSFTDVNGNTLSYTETEESLGTDGTWTDTLGRQVTDPIPHNWFAQGQSPGIKNFSLAGLDGMQPQQYQLAWQNLKPYGCEKRTDANCVGYDHTTIGGALEDQTEKLFFSNTFLCEGADRYDLWNNPQHPGEEHEVLFTQFIEGVRPCNVIDLLRDSNGVPIDNNGEPIPADGVPVVTGVRFNPVVLSKVTLPNGQAYQFAYNRYGEISKITYPTGAFEKFEYGQVETLSGSGSFARPYEETNRGVSERRVYAADGTLQQKWTYASVTDEDYPGDPIKITTVASTGSSANAVGARTVSYIYKDRADGRFGFQNPMSGTPIDERTYDENDFMRSRVLTAYITKDSRPLPNLTDRRDLRVWRQLSIMFEGNNPTNQYALATLSETAYDNDHSGTIDQSYFPHLNVKSTTAYNYVSVPIAEATSDSLETIAARFSGETPASITETDYSYDANYKARGIIGLPIETRAVDPGNPNNILAKSQMLYDETDVYPLIDEATTTGRGELVAGNPNLRGNVTTTRTWVKESNTWLSAHAQYDIYGNSRKVWDASGDPGKYTETFYSPSYNYAYPTKVIGPAPDPGHTTGTDETSSGETVYDFNTGLPLSTKNDFGQVTTMEYADALLRPTKVNPVVVNGSPTGPVTITQYSDGTTDATRYVKVQKQLDATNWDESTIYMDSLGRTIKTVAKDSQGEVVVETKYDLLGRAQMTSNPHRQGDAALWRLAQYDEAGRLKQTREPMANQNPASPTGNVLGTTEYGISTVDGCVGTVITTTDASGRKSRSITNSLGQLIRVDEATTIGGTADADLGPLASPVQPTAYTYDPYGKMVKVEQGSQKRYFKYDSLGRLLRVNQPEQEYNANLNLSDSYNTSSRWTAGFAYDEQGNITRATDANGVNIVNEYDRGNRITKHCYTKPDVSSTATTCDSIPANDRSTDTPTVSFFYDGKGLQNLQSPNYAKGKVTKISSSVSETQNTLFDNFGQLTETRQITDGQTYTSSYEYNLSGALIKETYPSGRVLRNAFESDGDLAVISSKENGGAFYRTFATSFSYTPDNRIKKLLLGNGLWESADFNTRLQLKELNLGRGGTADALWKLTYEYGELDPNGSVDTNKNTGSIAKQTVSFSGLAQPFVETYEYDSLYRLKKARETQNGGQTWIQTLGYDRYGNRTSLSQNIYGVGLNSTPAVDQYTNRFSSSAYHYDKNGNLTRDVNPSTAQTRTVVFNADNKQTEIKDINGVTIGKYYYDGEGRRVKKVTDQETTIFVYAAGKLVAEYSTAPPPANPTINYTATDQVGSPRVLTNALAEVVSRRDFMPFGEELFADGQHRTTDRDYSQSGQDAVRKRFTGYEKDMETGLDFAEARYYNDKHGRFTAVDPLLASGQSGNPQTFNRYVYVLNNPLILTDPHGLQAGTVSDLEHCTGNCEIAYHKSNNSVSGNSGALVDVIVESVHAVAEEILDFYKPAIDEMYQTLDLGGSPDQTARVFGNKGFTQREFFNTSNQFAGEVAEINYEAISLLDPSGQANLFHVTNDYASGKANIWKLAMATGGALLGPFSCSEGKLANGVEEEGIRLFRGVPDSGYFAFDYALKGIAKPLGGHKVPALHNNGNTFSIFTSWTTKLSEARGHAMWEGVVLEALIPKSQIVPSKDSFDEAEVLVTGIVRGAKVRLMRNCRARTK